MSSTTSSLAFNFDSNPDPAANATANRNRKKTLFGRFYSRSNSQNELVLSPTHLDSEQGKPIGRKVSQSINHFFSASLGVTGVVKVFYCHPASIQCLKITEKKFHSTWRVKLRLHFEWTKVD